MRPFSMSKKTIRAPCNTLSNSKKQFRAVEFFSRAAELIFLFILHTFYVELVPFGKATFSGQDKVRTSNPIASVTM